MCYASQHLQEANQEWLVASITTSQTTVLINTEVFLPDLIFLLVQGGVIMAFQTCIILHLMWIG